MLSQEPHGLGQLDIAHYFRQPVGPVLPLAPAWLATKAKGRCAHLLEGIGGHIVCQGARVLFMFYSLPRKSQRCWPGCALPLRMRRESH